MIAVVTTSRRQSPLGGFMNIRSALGIALIASTVVAVTGVGATASVAGTPQQDKIKHLTVLKARYEKGVPPHLSPAPPRAPAPSIPLFHQTVTDGATTFPYTMVGKDP